MGTLKPGNSRCLGTSALPRILLPGTLVLLALLPGCALPVKRQGTKPDDAQ